MKILDHVIIGTSAFARSYLAGEPKVADRFAHLSVTPDFCRTRSMQGASRSRLSQLVNDSMLSTALSEAQQRALQTLNMPDSVVVVTGQQIGMMGGPMYTLYKIRTAVSESRRIAATCNIQTVPVFWLEDNDHDAAEASQVTLPAGDGHPSLCTTWDGVDPRMPVSMRRVDAAMNARIADAASMLSGPFADDTRRRVLEAWRPGASWSDAFMAMLAPYLQRWGVLVVRASEVIRSGMHAPLVLREIEDGSITRALHHGTRVCEEAGLPVQAQPAAFGFFVIDAQARRRPNADEPGLKERAITSAHEFSPYVLTRPLVQDALLPTVASVLGAAELSYHAQLSEAYQVCGIEMPVPVLRHGATLLTPKVMRLLTKSQTQATDYLRQWTSVERDLTSELTQDLFPDATSRDTAVDQLLAPYRQAAESTDVTLVPTVAAQRAGIVAGLESLEGKIRAAIKRKSTSTLERARSIHHALMPADTLQERVLPLAYWESQTGIDALTESLEGFEAIGAGHHLLVELRTEQAQA